MSMLSPVDILFLQLEKRQQPMHVGGLFLFRPPEDAADDFVYQLVNQIKNSPIVPVAPFNKVLDRRVFWHDDDDFDIDHHFRHIALPRPGRIRELLVYVSQEHSSLLDRAKPLWECHIIEGIEDNRFAIYFKIHHGLVDGIAAMNLIKKAFSKSQADRSPIPFWAINKDAVTKKTYRPHKKSTLTTLKEQVQSIPVVANEIAQGFSERTNRSQVRQTHTPKSILNQAISSSRRVVAQSYAMERFRHIATHYDVTINDVVLAVCSGALREYLMNMKALPTKPLTAFVPISLRKDGSDSGNQISFMLANLATHLADPEERLRIISDTVKYNKERFGRMTQAQIINYSALVYGMSGLNLLSGIMPKRQGFNLIISNVPGSSETLYFNGAKLDALYPLSVLMDGQAMNITLASYVDKIEFGIIANSKVLPKIQVLLDLLEKQLQTYEQYCEHRTLDAASNTDTPKQPRQSIRVVQ